MDNKTEARGRKKFPEQSEDTKAMELVAKKYKDELLNAQQAEELYGDGRHYERMRLEDEVRFYQEQAGSALIEIGKRLIRMKAQEGHGGFAQVLENLNMASRTAQYAIVAAQKFSNTPTLAHLGSSKLKALTVLEDENIQTLEEGGEVTGLTLDSIDSMSTRDLRAALRKEKDARKKDREALEATITAKSEKLNAMELEAIHRPPSTKTQLAQAQLDEQRPALYSAILGGITCIRETQELFERACRVEGVNVDQLLALVKSLGGDLSCLKTAVDELGDMIDNPYPIKEELPCIETLS